MAETRQGRKQNNTFETHAVRPRGRGLTAPVKADVRRRRGTTLRKRYRHWRLKSAEVRQRNVACLCGARAGWIKLLELACSTKARLRCVALYGLMKHFGYIGPYDPFETGQTLARMAAGLKIAVERHR